MLTLYQISKETLRIILLKSLLHTCVSQSRLPYLYTETNHNSQITYSLLNSGEVKTSWVNKDRPEVSTLLE